LPKQPSPFSGFGIDAGLQLTTIAGGVGFDPQARAADGGGVRWKPEAAAA